MMRVIISPAKRLDEQSTSGSSQTVPHFLKEATAINQQLKKCGAKKLAEMMKLSQALAQLNVERNDAWKPEGVLTAAYTFDGEVYRAISFKAMTPTQQQYAHHHLWILSGLYGLLQPFDQIMPYRLEMGASWRPNKQKNLYDFWQPKVTQYINEIFPVGTLVNLASNEYSKAIDTSLLKARFVTCEFKERREGKWKSIMTYAKKARGMMTNRILVDQIEDIELLKKITFDNYRYQEELSTENHVIFGR